MDNRFIEAFSKYDMKVDQNAVKAIVKKAENDAEKGKNKETLKKIFSCIDLTTLKPTDNEDSVLAFVEKVNSFEDRFPDMPSVASICTYPCYASLVSRSLEVESVKTCCVSAGFPSAQTFFEVKVAETSLAIHDGADEIDIVQNAGRILNEDYETLAEETDEIKEVCGEKTLKVIIETGALGTLDNVKKAALLAMYSGGDFIKTSTGKEVPGADPESFCVMCQAIKEYYGETGRKVGIKAAGGISNPEEALLYWTIAGNILGKEWLDNTSFRIGASRLANSILKEITSEVHF
ncbi:MAG: deoxyribose-phosphate aldolase [Bacteroidaceae bacterium]|nr:deoxyribose-phosphate aldolase [Bacteroidaceae bacterium]